MKLFSSFKNRYTTPGKGVKKSDVSLRFGFRNCFSIFADKFWKLPLLNLLFFVVNAPLFGIFAYLAGVGGTPYRAPASVIFQPLYGASLHGAHPALLSQFGAFGVQIGNHYPRTFSYILLGIGLMTVFTFGVSFAAMTYIQRNFVRREPVDLGPDFLYCIKKNWKQSIVLGLCDLLFLGLIAMDMTILQTSGNFDFGALVVYYGVLVISLLYLMMRPFLYLLSVTFELKLFKLIKNSWILTIAGIGRNLLCFLAAALVPILNFVIYLMIPSLGIGMLFLFTVSVAWFFQVYGAWPTVKKHMIDPFYEEKSVSEESEETVFVDRG